MYDPDQGYPVPIGKATGNLTESRERLTRSLTVSQESLTLASKHTKLLLGCFRTGDANDPEVYTTAIVSVLAKYPEDVMRAVSDPVSGLPSRIQWLPSVKEVREACQVELYNLQRSERLRAMKVEPRRIAAPFSSANLHVPKDNPKYDETVQRAKSGEITEFRFDESGIWIPENAFQITGYLGTR